MARQAPRIYLSFDELRDLRQIVHARSSPQGLAARARIILQCARHPQPTNDQVAAELGCDPNTVSRWRRRFHRHRLDGLHDLPRSGRPAAFSP